MKRTCSHCGYEPEFDNGYERCPRCFQLYEVAETCTLCKVCLGCMLNTMKTNENKRSDLLEEDNKTAQHQRK